MGEFFRIDIRQSTQEGIKDLKEDLKKDLKEKQDDSSDDTGGSGDLKDLKKNLVNQYGLSGNQADILRAILQNRFITPQQLAERIGITPKNIRNNMYKLKSKGLLKRVGSPRGGYWQVLLQKTAT